MERKRVEEVRESSEQKRGWWGVVWGEEEG
jgi:hypothetical protein